MIVMQLWQFFVVLWVATFIASFASLAFKDWLHSKRSLTPKSTLYPERK